MVPHLCPVLGDVPARLAESSNPVLRLMGEVLDCAMSATHAASVALMIPTQDGEQLRFLVARGPVAEQLLTLLVPMRGSIAGYVYSTGQMMALGNLPAEKPSLFYGEIDRQVHMTTRSYLAVPVYRKGQVVGVATYVNRPGEPPYEPFQPDEVQAACALTSVQGALLHHWQRLQQHSQLITQDVQAALSGTPDEAPLDFSPIATGRVEAWARVMEIMDNLPRQEQDLCAELVALVYRRRQAPL